MTAGLVFELGDQAVRHAAKYGVVLDGWQAESVRSALAVDGEGQYAFSTVCDCEPRRNGKGETLQTVGAYGAHILGEHTLHSAHRLETAEDAFRRIDELAEHPYLKAAGFAPTYSNGKNRYRLGKGGVSYRARSHGAGRGLSDIDRIVYDEAQHLFRSAMAAASPTKLTSKFGQTLLSGSAGVGSQDHEPEDASEVWWDYRVAGILHNEGLVKTPGLLWRERTAETWTVDPETLEVTFITPDPHDRANWYRANPALGADRENAITEERLAGMMLELGEELFLRECLNVWDPRPVKAATGGGPLTAADWAAQVDPGSKIVSGVVLVADVNWDQDHAVIFAAGRRRDGTRHVELVDSAAGVGWLEPRMRALVAEWHPVKVGFDAAGPARVLRPLMERLASGRVELEALAQGRYVAACQAFVSGVKGGEIWHLGDVETSNQVASAGVRAYGDGWLWSGRSGGEVSALRAATVAAWVADLVPNAVSAYANTDSGLMTV